MRDANCERALEKPAGSAQSDYDTEAQKGGPMSGEPMTIDDAAYICPSCGEEIVVPIDYTSGEHQDYVEDCPVCCCPNLLHITIQTEEWSDGVEYDVRIHAEPESD